MPMRHRLAWSIFACAILLVLVGFWLILAALGWFGLSLRFLPGAFDLVEVVLFALVGCLFLVAGLAAMAVSMSMRMYSVSQETLEDAGENPPRDVVAP